VPTDYEETQMMYSMLVICISNLYEVLMSQILVKIVARMFFFVSCF